MRALKWLGGGVILAFAALGAHIVYVWWTEWEEGGGPW